MMDDSINGRRCRAARRIVHYKGVVDRDTPGTMRYAMENIGRSLVQVYFDSGLSLTVLADYVEVDADGRSAA